MSELTITEANLDAYKNHLRAEEKSNGTILKYLHDVRVFQSFIADSHVTKELAILWKEKLVSLGYAAPTVNSMLSSLNGFFRFMRWDDCKVKFLRIQHRLFRDSSRVLTRGEYEKLITTANRQGRERLSLLMETICSTGIRVSEVRYITVEAAAQGLTEISLKGKIRTILLPSKLCKKLLKYAKGKRITSGEIFLTRGGKSISRRQIWAEMKSLCKAAGIASSKVFPHNLRHLFARVFYKIHHDIVKLADTLGHSSIDTTRIYLISTGQEHRNLLEKLRLVT